MVLPASRRVPRVPRYSGTRQGSLSPFAYGACTLCRWPFQTIRLGDRFLTPRRRCNGTESGPTTPSIQRLQTWHIDGLGCSPFARRYWGNRICFLFLRVLRWFTSPGWLRHPMYSDDDLEDCPRGVAPFGNLRVKAYLALEDGPSGFPQGSTCPAVLRNQTREPFSFRLRGFHPVSPIVPDRSAKKSVSHSPVPLQ